MVKSASIESLRMSPWQWEGRERVADVVSMQEPEVVAQRERKCETRQLLERIKDLNECLKYVTSENKTRWRRINTASEVCNLRTIYLRKSSTRTDCYMVYYSSDSILYNI